MKSTLAITLLALLSFSCDMSDQTNESEENLSEEIKTDSIVETIIEGNKVIPPATVDDACLPYPSPEFCHLIQVDSAYQLALDANYLFAYVLAHFDSIEPRKYTEMEDEYDMGVYNWSQKFSDGVSYAEFFGGEGGATGTLYTTCSNLEAVYSTINAIVNYRTLDSEFEFEGTWNEEKTEYGPEEAGCYYTISLDDSTGYYKVENYCGC